MKNCIIHLRKITLLLVLLAAAAMIVSAQTLNGDGSTHTIDANGAFQWVGSAQDYTIPANSSYNSISFTLRGGDGGSAEAGTSGGNPCISYGGAGATTEAEFWIGNGTNELKPGGTIRFIVGKYGIRDVVAGTNAATGGGGGGTAVLYRPTSSDPWEILAAAGGGGGAYQGNVFFSCVDSQQGQGGRSTENGGNGEGPNSGNGGSNGNGGEGGEDSVNDISGGGGGAFSAGTVSGGGAGFSGGGGGGGLGIFGGWGFGGGGGGGGAASLGGGGGGGYSGGGGGGTANNGGGGGSYVNSNYAFSSTKTEGTNGGGTTYQNGHVDYTFEANAFTWTGAIDHNWHNSGNWSPTQVPSSANIVQIPAVVNDPYIWPGSPAEARFVRVLIGGELTVQSNGILNLYPVNSNGISNYGTITNMGGEVNIARYDGNANNDGILNEGGTFWNLSGGKSISKGWIATASSIREVVPLTTKPQVRSISAQQAAKLVATGFGMKPTRNLKILAY